MPTYTFDAGLKSFADIAKFKDQLDGKIYGIEPGNDGNRLILDMIKNNTFGLGSFELVESSEQGMLAQVERAVKRKQPIVFLGWEPHPMNSKYDMKYLSGGDDVFGPNYRRRHRLHQCPRRLPGRLPERRQVDQEPQIHAADGERGDGRDPLRQQGSPASPPANG